MNRQNSGQLCWLTCKLDIVATPVVPATSIGATGCWSKLLHNHQWRQLKLLQDHQHKSKHVYNPISAPPFNRVQLQFSEYYTEMLSDIVSVALLTSVLSAAVTSGNQLSVPSLQSLPSSAIPSSACHHAINMSLIDFICIGIPECKVLHMLSL